MEIDDCVGIIQALRTGGEETNYDYMDWSSDSTFSSGSTIVVIDTNILISNLLLVKEIYQLLEHSKIQLIIPNIVLHELDKLKTSRREVQEGSKHSQTVGGLSRSASIWLLERLEARTSILVGQKKSETLLKAEERPTVDNDGLILDVGLYFQATQPQSRIYMLTNDNNLALRAKFEDLHHISISTKSKDSAHDVLRQIDPTITFSRTATDLSTSDPPSRVKPSSTPSRHAPKSIPLAPPSATPSRPLSNSRVSQMEVEIPLTPLSPPNFSNLASPRTANELFERIAILMTFFMALPVYRFLVSKVKVVELGDWRIWNFDECLRVMRFHWDHVEELLEKGLRKTSNPVKLNNSKSKTSKWATKEITKAPTSQKLKIEKISQAVYSSLLPLREFFSWVIKGEMISALRATVVLEQLSLLLNGVYAAAVKGDITEEIKIVIFGFATELNTLGIGIDLNDFKLN